MPATQRAALAPAASRLRERVAAAQHFDLLHVEEVEGRSRDAAVIDLIHIETHALLDAIVGETERRTDAADVDGRVAGVGREELQAGLQLLQPVHVEGAGVVELEAVDGADGQGYVLRHLGATA